MLLLLFYYYYSLPPSLSSLISLSLPFILLSPTHSQC